MTDINALWESFTLVGASSSKINKKDLTSFGA